LINNKEIHRLVYYPSADSMTGKMFSSKIVLKKKYSGTGRNTVVAYPYRVVGEVALDAGLIDLLGFYAKDNYIQIIDTEGIDIKKNVKKEIMLGLLSEQIPDRFAGFLELMDETMYQTMLKIRDRQFFPLSRTGSMASHVQHLIQCGYLYRIEIEGNEFFYLPPELRKILDSIEQAGLEKTVKYNSLLYRIGKNILYYYGVVKEYDYQCLLEDSMQNFDRGNLKKSISLSTFARGLERINRPGNNRISRVINRIAAYSAQINKVYLDYPANGWYFAHPNIIDPCNIMFDQNRRQEIDFLPLSVNDLLADRYLDQKPIHDLTKYITEKLHVPYLEAVAMVSEWILYLKNGENPADCISSITERLKFDDIDTLNKMLQFASAHFFNDLNQWVIKGHSTKSVLSFQGQKGCGNSAGVEIAENQTVTQRTSRPGRNDPCLCGSGLKYKKCCGR